MRDRSYADGLTAYRQNLQHDLARYARLERCWSWLRLAAFIATAVVVAVVACVYNLPIASAVAVPDWSIRYSS